MDLKESQKKRVCRICHQPAAAKGPGDSFVLDFGKEHAHQSCLDWEKDSKKKIEQKEKDPMTIETLEKEIELMEKSRADVVAASEYYSSNLILSSWDGQIKIRKRFIKTLKKLEEKHKSQLTMIISKIDSIDKKTTELKERHDLIISELKRATNCTDEDIENYLGMPGQIRKPIVNRKIGEEIQKRFDLEDEIKRKDAQINEAIALFESDKVYEKIHIPAILRDGLSEKKELPEVMSTIKFDNGMISVLGYDHKQIPELQGEYSEELHRKITEASDENTEWKGWEPLEEKEK